MPSDDLKHEHRNEVTEDDVNNDMLHKTEEEEVVGVVRDVSLFAYPSPSSSV